MHWVPDEPHRDAHTWVAGISWDLCARPPDHAPVEGAFPMHRYFFHKNVTYVNV